MAACCSHWALAGRGWRSARGAAAGRLPSSGSRRSRRWRGAVLKADAYGLGAALVGPALLAGNTMVLKPSPFTPL